ncbi:MAG: YgcG family protein, partial [Planctomycetaceae bacterium]
MGSLLSLRCLILLMPLLVLGMPSRGWAQAERVPVTFPEVGEREFVVDKANLLTSAQEQRIRSVADDLLTRTSRPLLVVTVESMAAHGGSGMSIELFTRYLFGQLGLGRDDGRDGNRGMLLLVSRQDRKARIELGADWPVSADRKAEQIMSRAIIPRFRRQDFGGGIVAGAEALAKLAQAPNSRPAEAATPPGNVSSDYPDVDQYYADRTSGSSGIGGGLCCFLLPVFLILPLL